MQTILTQIKNFFDDYTTSFITDDDFVRTSLQLKIEHTDHVCREMDYLTDALDLDPEVRQLAHITALLHDIGRFPQFAQYRTFCDADSVDHSGYGADIIIEQDILASLAPSDRRDIITAVRYHGAKNIPNQLRNCDLLYTQLVRDADKLDIYRVILEKYARYYDDPDNSPYEVAWSTDPVCSPDAVEAVLANQPVSHAQMRTLADTSLARLAWVYDINFTAALARVRQRGYLEQTMNLLPDTPSAQKVCRHINAYIDHRLATSPTPSTITTPIASAPPTRRAHACHFV